MPCRSLPGIKGESTNGSLQCRSISTPPKSSNAPLVSKTGTRANPQTNGRQRRTKRGTSWGARILTGLALAVLIAFVVVTVPIAPSTVFVTVCNTNRGDTSPTFRKGNTMSNIFYVVTRKGGARRATQETYARRCQCNGFKGTMRQRGNRRIYVAVKTNA